MKVTRELQVSDNCLIEQFWCIYDEAFRKLRALAPCRQHLHEDEFVEKMVDERVLKFVLWDDTGAPVGMALVATDLRTVPWISPEFYAARLPEHYERGTLYYFGALLVTETAQRQHYARTLLAALGDFIFANDGVACFDCADVTDGFLPELIRLVAEERGSVECQKLGQQHYYAYITGGFRPGRRPDGEPDEEYPAR